MIEGPMNDITVRATVLLYTHVLNCHWADYI